MTYGRAPWLVELDGRTVADVAGALGYELVRRSPGKATYPCPACGSERRHRKSGDRRGAVDVADGKPRLWTCRQCEHGGDTFAFLAFAIVGKADGLSASDMCELERWTRDHFNVLDGSGRPGARRVSKQEAERQRIVSRLTAPRPETLPDAREVLDVWTFGRPVTGDAEAVAWCVAKGLDAGRVAELDLARVVPSDVPLPDWATTARGSTYPAAGWRLALPMYDGHGELRSLRWRRLDGRSGVPKTLASPCGGLVLADPMGRVMLAERMGEIPGAGGCIVLEGETDLAFVATRELPLSVPTDGFRPALLGYVDGAASREWGRRIPDGWLGIATDDDDKGDKYAAEVLALVAHRVRLGRLRVARWRPNVQGLDVSEAGGLHNGRWEPMVAAATPEGIAQ